MTTRTRFAPSPTGFLHVGGARTALFSWLYARRHKGEFILRIEDTDRERSTEAAVAAILADLAWLGLDHDFGPLYQSERSELYRVAVERLLDAGKAYRCYCTPEELDEMRKQQQQRGEKPRYDGRCRERAASGKGPRKGVEPVVRFMTPTSGSVVFNDLVHGRIEVSNAELDDLVLLRANGTPTYNLTVVVDDADVKITHVIRGDDHVSNTPRQIHLLQALGEAVPQYAHLPMILGEGGAKLSKRDNAAAIGYYRDTGYLPQTMLNYLARLGWSAGDQEVFSLDELIKTFSLEAVHVSPAALNPEKLKWLNRHYLQSLPAAELLPAFEEQLARAGFVQGKTGGTAGDAAPVAQTLEALRARHSTLQEMTESAAFIYGDVAWDWNGKQAAKCLKPGTRPLLEAALERLEALNVWDEAGIHRAIGKALAAHDAKLGQLGPALRFAVTGGAASPALAATLLLVGRKRCVERIRRVLERL